MDYLVSNNSYLKTLKSIKMFFLNLVYMSVLVLVFSGFIKVAKADEAVKDKTSQTVNNTQNQQTLETQTFAENEVKDIVKVANSKKKTDFLAYLDSKVKSYIAVNYMGAWILAGNLKKFNPQQRETYLEVFKDYLVNFYGTVIYQNRDSDFKLENVISLNPTEFVASYKVKIPKQNQTVEISFKIRKSLKENKLFVTDFLVNGISFLQAKRSEYTALFKISNNDPDTFIAKLKDVQKQQQRSS